MRRYPAINDISTDRDSPPAFLAAPPRRPHYSAKRLRAATERAYPDVNNLALPLPPERAFQRVLELIRVRGWRVVAQDEAPVEGTRRVQAVAITRLVRFRDDVLVEVRASGPAHCVIAMRSKSRLGIGDWGANARRIREFLRDLQAPA